MKKKMRVLILTFGLLCHGRMALADVPGQINFQGRVLLPRAEEQADERGVGKGEKEHSKLFPFTGTGIFKFAIVDNSGNVLWTNTPNSLTVPPSSEVSVPVKNGVFNVALGDPALGMPPITVDVFRGADRQLRVFFRTPKLVAFTEFLPPQKLLTVPYAFTAALAQSLPPGATIQTGTLIVSSAIFTDNIVASSAIFTGSVNVEQELKVGVDAIFLTNAGAALGNAITFTPAVLPAQIRTSLGTVAARTGAAATGAVPLIINAGATGVLNLNSISSGTVAMSLSQASNVGIGTSLPLAKLHVAGSILGDFGVAAATANFTSTMTAASVVASSGAFSSMLTVRGSPVLTQAFLDGAVAKTGDTMTGQLTLNGSTLTVTGQDASGFSMKLSSGLSMPSGTLNAGSVVAPSGAFSGKLTVAGSPVLTQASLDGAVAKAGDTMTGQLTLSASTLTVTGQDASGFSLKLSSGVTTPAGTINAGLFVGNGAGLTNINPANISAGTASINITGNAASITGTIAPTQISAGSLPSNVIASSIAVNAVQDASIVTISGSKVIGNIAGNAANVTGIVAVANGGTGANTASVALANLGALPTAGGTMIGPLNMSNTSINLTGPVGNVISQSSVTASSFFGDGSHLTGISAPNAVQLQAATPGTQQSGNMNISGTGIFGGNVGIGTVSPGNRLTVVGTIETRNPSGGIKFPDGTTQITAVAVGNNPSASLQTSNGSDITFTSLGPCITGSTVSFLSVANSTTAFFFSGGMFNAGGFAQDVACAFLLDGALVSGVSTPLAGNIKQSIFSLAFANMSFSYAQQFTSGASHNICVTCAENGGGSAIRPLGPYMTYTLTLK